MGLFMKKWILLGLLFSTLAAANTPPIVNGFQMKYGTSSGLVDLSNGSASALNCGSNTGYVPTWSGSTFSCAALPASGVTSVGATAPITSSGGSSPVISCIAATGSVAGCLSAADWTTFNGKQGALTFSAPLVNTTGTVSCTPASGSVNGCLSSTDWTTFNGKQSALGFTPVTNARQVATTAPLAGGGALSADLTLSCITATGSVAGCLSAADWTTFNGKQATGLTVLKAGDTMAGPLNMPSGTTPELTGGTSTTGITFPSSSTIAANSGGTEIWRTGSTGLTLGNTTAQTARLYIKQTVTSGQGLVIENGNNTRQVIFDWSTAGLFQIGTQPNIVSGNGGVIAIPSGSVANVYAGAVGFSGDGAPDTAFAWPIEFNTASANGALTTLAQLDAASGATVNGLPVVMNRNANATASTLACYALSGTAKQATSYWCARPLTQTPGSVDSEVLISTKLAGVSVEALRLKKKGLWEAGGSAPTVTCNSNAATVETGSSGTFGRFTIPASPGTSCVVTIPDTADSNPICSATYEPATGTAFVVIPMGCTTATSCTIPYGSLVASDKISFHCGAHI